MPQYRSGSPETGWWEGPPNTPILEPGLEKGLDSPATGPGAGSPGRACSVPGLASRRSDGPETMRLCPGLQAAHPYAAAASRRPFELGVPTGPISIAARPGDIGPLCSPAAAHGPAAGRQTKASDGARRGAPACSALGRPPPPTWDTHAVSNSSPSRAAELRDVNPDGQGDLRGLSQAATKVPYSRLPYSQAFTPKSGQEALSIN